MVRHAVNKFYIIIFLLVILALPLCGCKQSKTSSVINTYGDNILIVDSAFITNEAFQNVCEVRQNIPPKSNKRFKFIILSETNVNSSTQIAELKKKVLEGYTVIYPQIDREKLNGFLKSFSIGLENNPYMINGCVLKRDLNATTQTYYIQAIPSYNNAAQSSVEFIKSEIENAVTRDLPYKDKAEFLGVYISKSEYADGDIKEIDPFSANVAFDEFDSFNTKTNKNFTYSFDDKKHSIVYSTCYNIDQAEMEFFYAYIIVKDFYGNIKAISLKNSAFTHSGIKHTLTEEIPIYSGATVYCDIPELLKITFNFV